MDSFEKCCRLCAKEQEASVMIFGADTASMQLQSKLNKYLLIEVDEDDKLPKSICTDCCKQLHNVCEFIDKTRKAQETLLQHSLFYEQLKTIEETKNSRIPQISNITYQGLNEQIQTSTPHDEVTQDFAEITYLHGFDGENVTLTRNTGEANDIQPDDQNDKPFACKYCNKKFLSEFALKNHTWSHLSHGLEKPYVCTSCDKVFSFKDEFTAHFKEHKHSRYCRTCKRTFRTERNLKLHMEVHSSNKSLYTCNVCDRSYSTKSSFKNHIVSHSDERPYNCNICQKNFKRRQELRFHLNKHTGAKPFKCPKCDSCFSSSGNCYAHKMRMHPVPKNNVQTKTKDKGKTNSVTIETVTSNTTNTSSSTTKSQSKYQCQVCSHTFNKKENFTYHMYKHTGVKPYHCIHCEEKFVTRKGLSIHYENIHPARERPLALLSKNLQLTH